MDDGGRGGVSRYDRELIELLNELRVALPGVQILFAFLLPVPFAQRWAEVTSFQKDVYIVTLMAAALATVLFITPTSFHRIRFRRHDKRHMLRMANHLTIAGLVALSVAMTGAILLITDFLFGGPGSWIVAGVTGAAFVAFWFAMPIARGASGEGDDTPDP